MPEGISAMVSGGAGVVPRTRATGESIEVRLVSQEWCYAVLDEGHRIRNPDAEVGPRGGPSRTPHHAPAEAHAAWRLAEAHRTPRAIAHHTIRTPMPKQSTLQAPTPRL